MFRSCRAIRSQKGAQLAEFGPALAILVAMVLIPLLDFVVIPVRWMLAQDILKDASRRLSQSDKFSDAFAKMNSYPSVQSRLQNLGGITVQELTVQMNIRRVGAGSSDNFTAKAPAEISPAWLPGENNPGLLYTLEIRAGMQMSPVILFPNLGVSIPGLNAPIPVQMTAAHEWENLGKDPVTKQFYIAE